MPRNLVILVCAVGVGACSDHVSPSIAKANQSRHPPRGKLPSVPSLDFSMLEAPWPPAPRGRTNEHIIDFGPENPGSLTEGLREQIRSSIAQEPKVKPLLGSRYSFLSVDEMSPEQKTWHPARADAPSLTVLLFSYTNNATVRVRMKGADVIEAKQEPDLQPSEGVEEIVRAATLARADRRIKSRVAKMQAGGMVTIPPRGAPGFGHRVLYITFANPAGTEALYYANVDLTDDKVLVAGPASRETE